MAFGQFAAGAYVMASGAPQVKLSTATISVPLPVPQLATATVPAVASVTVQAPAALAVQGLGGTVASGLANLAAAQGGNGGGTNGTGPRNVETVKNATGKGNNITVKTQKEAEAILREARPEIPWKETYGPKSRIGAEVHGVDGSGVAPGHDVELPHIKWRDWTKGKSGGAEGHIYFESVNGEF